MKINRIILLVLDSVGIGELPDAAKYNDTGSNTLGNIARLSPNLKIPNLIKMGLGNIDPTNALKKTTSPTAAYGKATEKSAGKDSTTGHWEITGAILKKPFPTFLKGFPKAFIKRFEKAIGVKTLGNYSTSGTVVINELGEEHLKTGYPIIYTSADSVFQIAMHESVFSIEKQYEICEIARKMLVGRYNVGRVIARPFIGKPGNFTRTSRRKDFSKTPPPTVLDAILKNKKEVVSVGKIVDLFAGKGISRYVKTANNQEGIDETLKAMSKNFEGMIFTNLVDFDVEFGHRRNVEGYAKCLEEFDARLPEILKKLNADDLLIITADHGNDPSHHGTDHTREYIPILCFGESVKSGQNIGIRKTFADIGATIAESLDVDFETKGNSFLKEISIISN